MKQKPLLFGLALFLLAAGLFAEDLSVKNWTVPPYQTLGAAGDPEPGSDATAPRVFIGVQPCRLVDTRAGSGFPAGYGAPGLSAGVPRNFDLDDGPCSGLPSGVDAYSLNVTVVNTAGPGHLVIYPQGGAQPTVSSVNYVAGQTLANAVIVPAGTNGGVTVVAAAATNLLIDINGYFSDTLGNPANVLELYNSIAGSPTAFFHNFSTGLNSAGAWGRVGAEFLRPGYVAAGVRGEGRVGTLGISPEFGAVGSLVSDGSELAYGVLGHRVDLSDPEITLRAAGVFGVAFGSGQAQAGVLGYAPGPGNSIYGVRGVIGSTSLQTAGVQGTAGGGRVPTGGMGFPTAGVRGESLTGAGVLALTSTGDAVRGCKTNGTGTCQSSGTLGFSSTEGLFVGGGSSATGVQSFVEPHPTDASKMIRYVSLEGNESGTYFRGRGKFQNGLATIDVPEDFRIVTDPEGLTVQITPIGGMATFGVTKMDLRQIVAQASRDLEFSYLVQGVRRVYKSYGPIAENEKIFVPEHADQPLPAYLPESLKQRLISNGTYRPDGKVNMETARRLGWDKVWEKRSRPAPQPAED
jgi:hypothetical protein